MYDFWVEWHVILILYFLFFCSENISSRSWRPWLSKRRFFNKTVFVIILKLKSVFVKFCKILRAIFVAMSMTDWQFFHCQESQDLIGVYLKIRIDESWRATVPLRAFQFHLSHPVWGEQDLHESWWPVSVRSRSLAKNSYILKTLIKIWTAQSWCGSDICQSYCYVYNTCSKTSYMSQVLSQI